MPRLFFSPSKTFCITLRAFSDLAVITKIMLDKLPDMSSISASSKRILIKKN